MGSTAYDPSGQKIGRIGQVYYDGQTNQPTWVTVHTGLFGTHETFVPVQGAELGADRVKGRPEHRRRRQPLAAAGRAAVPLLGPGAFSTAHLRSPNRATHRASWR